MTILPFASSPPFDAISSQASLVEGRSEGVHSSDAPTAAGRGRIWRMVKTARCGFCEQHIRSGPGLFGFRLPPDTVLCEACGQFNRASFTFRANWNAMLIWKGSFLASILFGAFIGVRSMMKGEVGVGGLLFSVVAVAAVLGVFGGFIVALILEYPVTLVGTLLGGALKLWAAREPEGSGDGKP